MQKCMRCMGDIGQEAFCPHCGNEIRRETALKGQLPEGTILNRRYIAGHVIGRDSIGITYIAWDAEQEQMIAIKEWFPEGFSKRKVNLREAEFSAAHPVIVSLQNQFLEFAKKQAESRMPEMLADIFNVFSENGTAYYTMEYLEGKTLRQLFCEENPIKQDAARKIFDSLLHTVEEMHLHGIVHGNLTPDNVVITKDGRLVFLNRRWFSADLNGVGNLLFSENYAAPEVCAGTANESQDLDTYSVYAIYYRMLTGIEPVGVEKQLQRRKLPTLSELGVFIQQKEEKEIMQKLSIRQKRGKTSRKASGKKRFGVILFGLVGVAAAGAIFVCLQFSKSQNILEKTEKRPEGLAENILSEGTTESMEKETDSKEEETEQEITKQKIMGKERLNSSIDTIVKNAGGKWCVSVSDTGIDSDKEVVSIQNEMQDGNEIRYLFFAERVFRDIIASKDYNNGKDYKKVIKELIKKRNKDEYNANTSAFSTDDLTWDNNITQYAIDSGSKEVKWEGDTFRCTPKEGAKLLERIYADKDSSGSFCFRSLKTWINAYNQENSKGCVMKNKPEWDALEFYSEAGTESALEYFACITRSTDIGKGSGFKIGIMAKQLPEELDREELDREDILSEIVTDICEYYESQEDN